LRFVPFKGPNRADVSLPLFQDANRSSFRNAVLSAHLEFRTVDKAHKLSVSECYAPSSEQLRTTFASLLEKVIVALSHVQH
jgi:hypothetical protein